MVDLLIQGATGADLPWLRTSSFLYAADDGRGCSDSQGYGSEFSRYFRL